MERPSRDEVCMEVAKLIAGRGTCLRAQVGAAIAKDGRILVTGYNGPPSGLDHCDQACFDASPNGCLRSVHAEANCIAFAAKHGIATEGADLYCSHLPCLKCAELIINSGIKRLYYCIDYRIKDGWILLQQAGVDMIQLT